MSHPVSDTILEHSQTARLQNPATSLLQYKNQNIPTVLAENLITCTYHPSVCYHQELFLYALEFDEELFLKI